MTAEAAVEVSAHAGLRPLLPREDRFDDAGHLRKRQPLMISALLWAARITCIGYMMCYAYHLGF